MKTSFVRWVAVATLSAIGLWNGSALAAAPPPVPQTLQQQGRILDSDGAPVSSKVHFVFNVYAKASGGMPLWTEEQDITLDDGYFSTELGAKTAFADLFDGSTLYLGVTVGNDDEMAPRQTVSSVPYALLAGAAVTVPFTGISGVPAACADGKYLKGFAADGTAACGTLPALSCHTVLSAEATSATSTFVNCPAGEVATGGGCTTNGALRTDAFWRCGAGLFCLCQINAPCPNNESWLCTTGAAATITAQVRCCTVQ
jgi:hypothetical protein